ncbi:SipW-dependent-type signal peptide-containing protein [Plantibacter cousiniae (nom. nud.)]|uniref:SipW-cognate class signal peptide n=1 Tax=Plantibacter cousiniae (nom. nud.) TaxID=199709 RepID=A0ABY1LPF7_9MICO|nr:SipW-dependent-type signal peptide-containing protein [Plantibacter cousiniae]SKC70465.1 SipW-cognate class signal peptide [Plantibacter cousiniae]
MTIDTSTEAPAATGTETPVRGLRSKRAKAILAGGLVLGVGAAITLAAWNDSEFATGIFAGGAFSIEGSTNGTTFSEHPTAAAAAPLTFAVEADNLAPEEPVYAGFAVQLTSASTYAATVDIEASSTAPIASSLTYSVVTTATFGCDAASFAAGDALVTDAATTSSTAADIFTLGAVTAPVYLCFEVTPAASLPQASPSGAVVWEFSAVSTTPLP